jgi:hypothetical protein
MVNKLKEETLYTEDIDLAGLRHIGQELRLLSHQT